MNVVTFFSDLASLWDKESKCNSCWNFGAPLSESGMNATKPAKETECCTFLIVTSYKTRSGYNKNNITQLFNRQWCDHTFTLWAVRQANLGLNTYNEQEGHPIDESLWKTILEPIQNCLGCGNELELCQLGYTFEITGWEMEARKYFGDDNYTGWKINGTFRQYYLK